jgi:hypothetical protein
MGEIFTLIRVFLGTGIFRFFLWGIVLLVWALVILLISYTFVILFKKSKN